MADFNQGPIFNVPGKSDGTPNQSSYDALQGTGYFSALYGAANKNLLSTLRVEAYDKASRGNEVSSQGNVIKQGYSKVLGDASKAIDVFQVPYNPASVCIEYRNDWQSPQGLGTSGAKLTFSQNEPEQIKFKLIFADSDVLRYGYDLAANINVKKDRLVNPFKESFAKGAANIVNGGNVDEHRFSDIGVDNQVHHFLGLTTQKIVGEGDNKRPPYLVLRWGHVLSRPLLEEGKPLQHRHHYPCQLASVDVNYTLFSRHGFPLRAELDCVFIEDYET